MEEDESESSEVADGTSEDKWYMHKVSLTQNVRNVQFEAVKGIGEGTIAVDDVTFTTETCKSEFIAFKQLFCSVI